MKRSPMGPKTFEEALEKRKLSQSKARKKIKKPLRKKSKNPIPTLKRKLWDACRKFIYQRDGDICFTCDKPCSGSNRHAGHFIPDSICPPSLRYDERNIRVQCYHCNINLGGWGERYAERMEMRFGEELVSELRNTQSHNKGEKWERVDFEKKIEYYKNLISL